MLLDAVLPNRSFAGPPEFFIALKKADGTFCPVYEGTLFLEPPSTEFEVHIEVRDCAADAAYSLTLGSVGEQTHGGTVTLTRDAPRAVFRPRDVPQVRAFFLFVCLLACLPFCLPDLLPA